MHANVEFAFGGYKVRVSTELLRRQPDHGSATIPIAATLRVDVNGHDADASIVAFAADGVSRRRCRDLVIELRATQLPFGWRVTVRVDGGPARGGRAIGPSACERVIHQETITSVGATTVVETRCADAGHPCESNSAYRWLGAARGSGAPFRIVEANTSTQMHRARRDLERFRLTALDAAERAVSALDLGHEVLSHVPSELHDTVLEVVSCDSTGRIAQLATLRPQMIHSLAIALGDAPGRWVTDGRLSAPLQLVVDGTRDRDVLAAAIATGLGRPATDARVSRLRAFGSLLATVPDHHPASVAYAYLGAALDVDCRLSWLSEQEGGIGAWARAQCWADALSLPLPAASRRYVACYGGEADTEIRGAALPGSSKDLLECALRRDASAFIPCRLLPETVIQNYVDEPFPAVAGVCDVAVVSGIAVERVQSGAALRALGREFRNCLGLKKSRLVGLARRGLNLYFRCVWPGEECLVELVADADGWTVGDIRAPRNRELSPRDHSRVVGALVAAVPGARARRAGAGNHEDYQDARLDQQALIVD